MTETINVPMMLAPMQFSDTEDQKRHDAQAIFQYAAESDRWWVFGTESFERGTQGILRTAAKDHGYNFYIQPGQDSWVAVRKNVIEGKVDLYQGPPIIKGKAKQYSN
jgi:hypothetical protein